MPYLKEYLVFMAMHEKQTRITPDHGIGQWIAPFPLW